MILNASVTEQFFFLIQSDIDLIIYCSHSNESPSVFWSFLFENASVMMTSLNYSNDMRPILRVSILANSFSFNDYDTSYILIRFCENDANDNNPALWLSNILKASLADIFYCFIACFSYLNTSESLSPCNFTVGYSLLESDVSCLITLDDL
jgi:hypothetical protein